MITELNFPLGYTPYGSVGICSNKLLGDTFILTIGRVLPVLIGKGTKPQIWIQAITDVQEKAFMPIVEASIPLFPFVRVESKGKKMTVSINGKAIVALTSLDDDSINIAEIDLRPIGINMYGDSKSLHAGGMEFSNSTFSGGGTFIGFTLD